MVWLTEEGGGKKTSDLTYRCNKNTFKCFYPLFMHISESSTATVCKAGPKVSQLA